MATEELTESFWHTFCDKCIEDSKKHVYSKEKEGTAVKWVLWKSLKTYLELMHPFIPFITERIWQQLPKSKDEPETIMYGKWPGKI